MEVVDRQGLAEVTGGFSDAVNIEAGKWTERGALAGALIGTAWYWRRGTINRIAGAVFGLGGGGLVGNTLATAHALWKERSP